MVRDQEKGSSGKCPGEGQAEAEDAGEDADATHTALGVAVRIRAVSLLCLVTKRSTGCGSWGMWDTKRQHVDTSGLLHHVSLS